MLTRRSVLAWPAVLCYGRVMNAVVAGGARRVAIVYPSRLEPCAQAAEGLRLRLAGDDPVADVLDMDKPMFSTDMAQAMARRPSLIVAVGSDAVRSVLSRSHATAIISTMTLEADQAETPQSGRLRAAVYLDIQLSTLVGELRKLFPGRTRIGVIRNPSRTGGWKSAGTELQTADCAAPDELLPVFLSLRRKVDFVICLPDGSLYNGATARPLIMASIENRLPIVGFSPAFLRAGAAVAVYPEYRAIGQQTADLVRRCLQAGEYGGAESPRKVTVAVNAKVLRMLGIAFDGAAHPEAVVLR